MTDLDLAKEAARRAAAVIAARFGHVAHADFKGSVDPVTDADRSAEDAIRALLAAQRPGDRIMGEEQGGDLTEARTWIVDPLDGTINFLHGVPHVAVSIGLVDVSHITVAVVHDVFREEVFWAERGVGAFVGDRRLGVSDRTRIGDALIATGFPYDRQERAPEYAAVLGRVLAKARGIRRMGTASLDLAYVAAGRFDGYWEYGLQPWDVAAGALLVEEAGGQVTDAGGEPIALARLRSIVATNGSLHDPLIVEIG